MLMVLGASGTKESTTSMAPVPPATNGLPWMCASTIKTPGVVTVTVYLINASEVLPPGRSRKPPWNSRPKLPATVMQSTLTAVESGMSPVAEYWKLLKNLSPQVLVPPATSVLNGTGTARAAGAAHTSTAKLATANHLKCLRNIIFLLEILLLT